jgi:uncharacterized protein (TIGR00369 family)
MEQRTRERTFSWTAPSEVRGAILGRPQLEWMADMIAGRVPPPPFPEALNLSFDEAERGRVVFSVVPEEWSANPMGVVHGGFLTSLLDSAMTLAVVSRLAADRTATTLDLQIHFVRAVPTDGRTRLRAEGIALHVGGTIGTAEGKITDTEGHLIAHGTSTMAILVPR